MMNTKDGYSKLTLDNTLVLLANGETKTISSIISNVVNADTVDSYHGFEFIRKDTYTTITFNDNLYLGTNSTNVSSVVSDSHWKYVKLSVKKGDKFLIKGDGGSTPRLWAFANTSNVIQQRADSEQNYANYQTITANLDGYLIVNFDKSQSPEGSLVPISWVSGFLNKANYTDYTVTKTGGGASGNWGINITGNAATANSANRLKVYTEASNNTNVYRIIGQQTLNAGWVNKGLVLAIASRHSGVGIYTIHYGAEISNGYYADHNQSNTDTYYTFANVYCKIRYFGDTHDTSLTKIICHVKPASGNNPKSAVFTFFLHSTDGSSPRISILQDWGTPFTLIENGATMSTIDTSVYGELKESTVMNESNSCTGNSATATKATQDSDGNSINTTYLKLTGGTLTGALNFNRDNNTKIQLRTDSEGGNIRIYAPDSYKYYTNNSGNQSNSYWEMDAHNGDLRFYTYSGGDSTHSSPIKAITFRASDGYILNNITGTAVGLRQEKVAGLNDTTVGRFFTTSTSSPSNGTIGTNWHCGLTIAPNNDSNHKSLIVFYGTDKNKPLYIRAQSGGTWGDWRKVLDSSNYTDYVYSKSTSDDRYQSKVSALGSTNKPVYISSAGTFAECSAYPTSLPASDVYTWAKASTKPSYSWSEIGSKPTLMTLHGTANVHDNTAGMLCITISNPPSGDVVAGKFGSVLQWSNSTYTPSTQNSSNWYNQLFGLTDNRLYFRTRTNGGNWTALKKIAWTSELPTKVSQLTNDSGFITSAPVTSVNGNTGAVTLNIPQTWVGTLSLYDAITNKDSNVFYFIIE